MIISFLKYVKLLWYVNKFKKWIIININLAFMNNSSLMKEKETGPCGIRKENEHPFDGMFEDSDESHSD